MRGECESSNYFTCLPLQHQLFNCTMAEKADKTPITKQAKLAMVNKISGQKPKRFLTPPSLLELSFKKTPFLWGGAIGCLPWTNIRGCFLPQCKSCCQGKTNHRLASYWANRRKLTTVIWLSKCNADSNSRAVLRLKFGYITPSFVSKYMQNPDTFRGAIICNVLRILHILIVL